MSWTDPQTIAMVILAGHFLGSLLNTLVSGDTTFGKIINALALGFGKARPDASRQ